MTEHVLEALHSFPTPNAPAHLARAIVRSIIALERRRARTRVLFSLGIMGAAAASLVPTTQAAFQSATASGFVTYVSLAFSDTDVFASLWYEMLQLAAETLPLPVLACSAVALGLCIAALPVLSRNLRIMHTTLTHTTV